MIIVLASPGCRRGQAEIEMRMYCTSCNEDVSIHADLSLYCSCTNMEPDETKPPRSWRVAGNGGPVRPETIAKIRKREEDYR